MKKYILIILLAGLVAGGAVFAFQKFNAVEDANEDSNSDNVTIETEDVDDAETPKVPGFGGAVSDEKDDEGDKDIEKDVAEESDLPLAFVSIHVEPNSPSGVKELAADVEAFVDLADNYDIDLTIMLGANWPEYYSQDEMHLQVIESWVNFGHEIAMHHHGLSHAAWDGYSNSPMAKNRKDYRGTMDDLMATYDALGVDIITGSGTDEDTDWPSGVPYAADGFEPGSSEYAISEPSLVSFNGHDVWLVKKRGYATDKPVDETLDFIIESISEAVESGEIVGVNTSYTHIGENMDEWEKMFEVLSEATEVKTVRVLLGDL